MASLIKYAGTVSQTTGTSYSSFSNLGNLKNGSDGSLATTSDVKGKSTNPNRPSTLSFTNFNFNLPTGAEVTKVVVTYRQKKSGKCSVGAPTISLLGVSGFSATGVAPSKTTLTTSSKTFTGKALTRTIINSSSFGVKVNYPKNSGTGTGKISLSCVNIKVEYKVPSYSLNITKVSGGYNEEKYTIQCSISNKNLTSYNPTLTLTAPSGFSFESASGSGSYTKVNNRTITWNPKLTNKIGTASINMSFDVNVTYPVGTDTYTGTFTLVESLYSTTKNYTATITEKPTESSEEDPERPVTDGETATINAETEINVISEDPFTLDLNITTETVKLLFTGEDNVDYNGTYTSKGEEEDGYYYTFENISITGEWTLTTPQKCKVVYSDGVNDYYQFYINVKPVETSLTFPNYTILEPSEEEVDRLGDTITYVLQCDIKHNTTDNFIRDWYKNNRIGVFNNEPTLFSDTGTTASHNDNWNGLQYMTRTDTGTIINNTSEATLFDAIRLNNSDVPFVNNDLTVEFEIVENNVSTNTFRFDGQTLCDGETYRQYDFTFAQGETGRFKFVYDKANNTITKYKDGEYVSTHNHHFCGNVGFLFRIATGTSLKYKDFKIVSNNPTEEEIFATAEYWSKATGGLNEYNNCECEFTYDSQYPLYILVTGDYPEATSYGYDIGTLQFTEPCIIEKELYTNRLPTGVYPVPIRALLGNDETANLTLMTNQSSDSVIFYQLPLDEDYGTNDEYAIRGVKVEASVEQTDPIVIQAKLHKPDGEIGQRSTVLDSNSTEISIGGLGDLWGFTTLQLTQLEDWEIELSASNILNNSEANINFNDVSITFYLEPIIHQEISVYVEDENLAYYGAFIETIQIPEGLETDTSFLTVDGTDTNDAYRQNIREKKIEITFNLSNCDLQTSTNMLRQLAKLFTNEKDQYNRPIPKHIRFSHYPNDYFEYIMEEPFDVDTELTDYNVKAKLTIPSGTSYSLEDTVTNTVGNANGLAPLNPIIRIRPSSSNIQIKENNSEQSFQMGYSGDWNDYSVEIDCEDRIVYLVRDEDDKVDISKYVDHNSDWFRLSGEYEFEGINCTILTVTFNERW